MKYLLPSHITCDNCGHGWHHDGLEVVEVEPGGRLTAAEALSCPRCDLVGELDLGEIRLRTAWPTSRAAGRLIERHGGRATVRAKPLTDK